MKNIGMRIMETRRLILRKFEMRDAPLFFSRLGGSEKVTEHMLWVPHEQLEDSAASIEKAIARYKNGDFYRWAIAKKEDDTLIGMIDLLRICAETNSCSFAYMLGEEFWGQGYATEALMAVFRFAFEEMDMDVIEADHFADNPASGAVMRKAGMRYQKTVIGKYEKNGKRHDAVLYRITACQWQEHRNKK